jgi:biopolymer transport protein ExbB
MGQESLIQMFQTGGLMMWPLLACALAALAILFERLIVINRIPKAAKAEKELEEIERVLSEGGIEAAAQKLAKGKGALNYIFARLVKRFDTLLIEKREYMSRVSDQSKSHDSVTKFLTTQAQLDEFRDELLITVDDASTDYLMKFMVALNTVSEVAPLMGLLGTITGMIAAFGALAAAGQSDSRVVANGIKEALYTTATGLFIAIPAIMGYRWIGTKAQAGKAHLELYAITFSNSLLALLQKEQ